MARRRLHGLISPTMREIGAAAGGDWWAPPVLIVLGVLAALTEGIGIGILIPLFATMFGGEADTEGLAAIVGGIGQGLGEEQRVALLAAIVLALVLARSAIQFVYEALSIWVSGRVCHRLRIALFSRLLQVGYAWFSGRETGRLFDIVRGETWLVGEFLMLVSRALISLCAILVFGTLLMLISPLLTLAAAIGAGVIALAVRLVTARMGTIGKQAVDAGAALSGRTIEALASMRTIRLFGQETRELERFKAASERDRVMALRLETIGAAIQPASELLYAPLFLLILLAAWQTGMAFPTLVAYLVLLYRVQPHARRLDHIRVEMAGMMPMVRQVAETLRREGKPYVPSGSRPYRGFSRAVTFEQVSFAHDEGGRAPAVTDVSFVIAKNQTTALVGESGAGKSTLANMLFRLYDPISGRILVDDTPLGEFDLAGWRRALAFAGQDSEPIGETIRDAIAYGRPDADDAAIREAARRADAEGFIRAMPKGYDTPIGERGLQLSAGQRQRLGIARALVRDPEILFLDEATSALDSESETLIQDVLANLAGSLTIVIIAHRLSTIRHAGHVVVLRGGGVVEQGRPEDLLATPGSAFARLWKLQSGAFQGPSGALPEPRESAGARRR